MLPKTTLIIAISIVLLAALIRADVEDYELRFAFNVHSDNEMPQKKIKIQMEIVNQDSSLLVAYQQVKQIQQSIIKTVDGYCEEFLESDYDCLENLSAEDVVLEAFYRSIKGEDVFEYFKATQQFELEIINEGNFGHLIDLLQQIDNLNVMEVYWSYDESEMDENILEKGREEALSKCHSLGEHLYRIVSVSRVEPQQKQEQAEQEPAQGEQEEQEEEEPQEAEQPEQTQDIAYRFQIICKGKYVEE